MPKKTTNPAAVETDARPQVETETRPEVQTITLPNRSALWREPNTGGGYVDFIPAGTYPVTDVKNGFTLIEGKGWVHIEP